MGYADGGRWRLILAAPRQAGILHVTARDVKRKARRDHRKDIVTRLHRFYSPRVAARNPNPKGDNMRQILIRFGVYLLIVAVIFDILGYDGVVGLVLVGLLLALVFELICRCISWGRRRISTESEQIK